MGSDEGKMRDLTELDISIHAPAWGATESVREVGKQTVISIHAPTWGATKA